MSNCAPLWYSLFRSPASLLVLTTHILSEVKRLLKIYRHKNAQIQNESLIAYFIWLSTFTFERTSSMGGWRLKKINNESVSRNPSFHLVKFLSPNEKKHFLIRLPQDPVPQASGLCKSRNSLRPIKIIFSGLKWLFLERSTIKIRFSHNFNKSKFQYKKLIIIFLEKT